ncbi:unnamed protein product, partial [Cyprideis torosa]
MAPSSKRPSCWVLLCVLATLALNASAEEEAVDQDIYHARLEEIRRVSLVRKSLAECDDVLLSQGFFKRYHVNGELVPVPEEYRKGPYSSRPAPAEDLEENNEAPTEEGDSAPPSPSNLPIRAGPPPPASQSCGQPLGELGTKMLVEQSKKRAMERRLTRLVEKFSSRLTEGLAAPLPPQAPPGDRTPRRQSGRKQETTTPAEEEVGSDFEPDSSSDESEEEATREMEAEEAAAVTSTEVKEEVEALTQEAELSQEDFLAQFLPPGYLEQRDQLIAQEVRDDQPKSLENGSTVSPKEESDLALLASGPSVQAEDLPSASSTMEEDGEWKLEDEERVEAGDEEDTLKEAEEEEKRLGEDDHEKELQELEEMMRIPVEELRAKYAGSPPSVSDDSSDSTAEDETDNETEDGDGMPDVGLEHLLEDLGGASPLRKVRHRPFGAAC